LIAVLLLSLFYDRFFCKYLCPAGALYGIITKISPFKVKRNPCIDCGKCTKNCPMNIDVAKSTTVKSAECIDCGTCINVCPDSKKYIGFNFFNKRVNPLIVIIITVGVFFGSLMILEATGLYQVSIPSIQQIEQEGKFIKIGDLRGSMTIEEGAKSTGKTLDKFYEIMEIPKTVAKDTLLKSVSAFVTDYDFHVMKAKKADQ